MEIPCGRTGVRYVIVTCKYLFVYIFFIFLYLTWALFQITAAHICYLIAEANFESYSDTARLCLIGADHWKLPRTYASPEAIQVHWIIHAFFLSPSLEIIPVHVFYLDMVVQPCRTHAFNYKLRSVAPNNYKMDSSLRHRKWSSELWAFCNL